MDRASRAIAQWKKERPDLDVSPMAVIGRISEAANVIARDHLSPVFARFDLQQGEFDVLATLRRTGAPYSLTPTALFEATMVTSGAMTARLDRLEKAGLVIRDPHPHDRRAVTVRLTDEGKSLIDRALTAHVANEHEILAGLTPEQRATLAGLLERLLESLRRPG